MNAAHRFDPLGTLRKPLTLAMSIALSTSAAVAWIPVTAATLSDGAGTARPYSIEMRRASASAQRVATGRRERAVPVRHVDRVSADLGVSSCADDGSASTLRSVLATAVSGDTIDLTTLACSAITLEAGALVTAADSLQLVGPGAQQLAIDADHHDSVIIHAGTGTLSITGLTLRNGNYDADLRFPLGGCVYSTGSIRLVDASVSTCRLTGLNYASGGAIYASGNVDMVRSRVDLGSVRAYSGSAEALGGLLFVGGALTMSYASLDSGTLYGRYTRRALGAGAYVLGNVSIDHSTISGNIADPGVGGGLFSGGDVAIDSSTFTTNTADYGSALVLGRLYGTTPLASMTNSTISGNFSLGNGAAAESGIGLSLSNSTIAFNQAYGNYSSTAAGLLVAPGVATTLQSSIIANNLAAGEESDFSATDLFNTFGSGNLIMVATDVQPPGSLHVDPSLAPLADNGGPTPTHALLAGSVAIDAGNDLLDEAFDQRGPGHPRVVGSHADIGAFEWPGDPIFADGFD